AGRAVGLAPPAQGGGAAPGGAVAEAQDACAGRGIGSRGQGAPLPGARRARCVLADQLGARARWLALFRVLHARRRGPHPRAAVMGLNRTVEGASGAGAPTAGAARAKSNPELITTFEGLNFNQQRFANGGNQFSVEPPDQALCVGNGYVVESTNSVLRVF